MVSISCRTNIDEAKMLQWPTYLPERPQVGDLIRSTSSTKTKHIELAVVKCTWIQNNAVYGMIRAEEWYLEVELHLPPHRFESILDFERFLKK